MNLTAAGAQYMSLGIMFLELSLKIVTIYTMFIFIKALKVYVKKNS